MTFRRTDSDRPSNVVVLGSTGSIGTSTLDVIRALPQRLCAYGLSGNSHVDALIQQSREFRPRFVTIADTDRACGIDRSALKDVELLVGRDGLIRMATDCEAHVVVSAIVGAAGLESTWAALEAGKTVALANKETLVVAGPLVTQLAEQRRTAILPIDSEHSAVFQAMESGSRENVRRIVLTASGGPFRGMTRNRLHDVTPEDALRHPTWQMGAKITIDSATLMNKAMEVIEARWLFDIEPDKIDVIVHPESIVHSFVEFVDGSVVAQLSPPDMRLPIQYALTYPDRVAGPAKQLDWQSLTRLSFEQPDHETFPALQLGYEVARRGGTCGAVLNAANEAAVGRFLAGELRFLDIPRVCRAVLHQHDFSATPALEELWKADRWARNEVARWTCARHPNPTPL
ncbi:MAG: 1-deoxy-D-xylulose-5-phosphate reductoisomerase [Gemmataceae bacterium]